MDVEWLEAMSKDMCKKLEIIILGFFNKKVLMPIYDPNLIIVGCLLKNLW